MTTKKTKRTTKTTSKKTTTSKKKGGIPEKRGISWNVEFAKKITKEATEIPENKLRRKGGKKKRASHFCKALCNTYLM